MALYAGNPGAAVPLYAGTDDASEPLFAWSGKVPEPPPPPPEPEAITSFRYRAPNGAVLTLGKVPTAVALVPRNTKGLSALDTVIETSAAPGQWGGTAVASVTPPRNVTMAPILHVNDTHEDMWKLREAVAAAMVTGPSDPGEDVELGELEVRYGKDTVRAIRCVGRIRDESWLTPKAVMYEFDWFCPDARWRSRDFRTKVLRQTGAGFHGPIHGPLFSTGGNVEELLTNVGTAEAPMVLRFRGSLTSPAVVLADGSRFKLDQGYVLPEGEEVRVDTSLTGRGVWHVDSEGVVTEAPELMDDSADFIQLPATAGGTVVRLEADEYGTGGEVVIGWYPSYGGI